MNRCVRLVFMAGYPVTLDLLCPKTQLLMLQSRLAAQGIVADIADFSFMESAPSVYAASNNASGAVVSGWMKQASRGWGGFPILLQLGADSEGGRREDRLAQRLERVTVGAPQVVLYWAERREDFPEIKALSGALRLARPEIRQLLAGPYAMHYGACALGDCDSLDAAVTGDVAAPLAQMLEQGDDWPVWSSVPGVIYRDADGSVQRSSGHAAAETMRSQRFMHFQRQEAGAYFSLFPLSFSLCPAPFYYQDEQTAVPQLKTTAALIEEMKFLQRRYNAQIFSIAASHVAPDDLADFADALLTQNLVVIYSLNDVTEEISGALADRLFASGCRSLGFRVPTGSQIVLEDFYGYTASISAMRASVRAVREAGIFSVLHICYPCPGDDYHTRAETELFLEAAKPDAVCMEAPAMAPESRWFRRASEYGFFVSHKEFHRFVVGEKTAYGSLPYTMRGWSGRRIHQAQASLAAFVLKTGAMLEVTEAQGLLARVARSAMEESEFLDTLKEALEHQDRVRLAQLAACVNSRARSLQECSMGADLLEKAAASS